MVSKRSRILLVKNILMKHLQCHKNNAPQLKKKKTQIKKHRSLSMKEIPSRCFPYFQIYLEVWRKTMKSVFIMHLSWSTSGTSSHQSINPTMLCLLPAHRETVNKPTVQSMAFLFFFFFSLCLSFSCLYFFCFSQQEGRRTENRKSVFVPFINCIINVPPKEGMTNVVGRKNLTFLRWKKTKKRKMRCMTSANLLFICSSNKYISLTTQT